VGDRDGRGCSGNDSHLAGDLMTPHYMRLTCETCRHQTLSMTQNEPGFGCLYECRADPPKLYMWAANGETHQMHQFPVVGTGINGKWCPACSKHEPKVTDSQPSGDPPF
jgi:hypothetical protein